MRVGLFVSVFALVACGSVDGAKKDAATADTPGDTKHADAAIDTPAGPMDAPTGTYPLTVKNYLAWCSVSVNNGAASSAGMQVVNFMPGTIPLSAAPLANFALAQNMWHHTDGDAAGTGEGGTVSGMTSSTTVTVGMAAKCVWVCCPFTDGTGCPTADQCP